MASFDYDALDASGRRRRGVIAADSARQARSELRRRKLAPLSLGAARGWSGAKADSMARARRLGHADLTLIIRQLSTVLSAAAPVEEALASLAAQIERPALKSLLLAVRSDVMRGLSLSDSLARQPRAFPSLHVALVAAGEKAGALPDVLERLAVNLESASRTRRKILTALAYPIMLAVVATGVVIALMLFVVPKVVEQFTDLGQQLPFLTRLMIGISDFLGVYGLALFAFIAALTVGAVLLLRREAPRRRVERLLLEAPLLGKAIRTLHALRLARILATLVGSDIPVTDALAAARRTIGNRTIGARLETAINEVREGGALGDALRRADILPPMVVTMVALGERTNRLDAMLEKAADHLEESFDAVTATALSLVEPAIIIAMGGIVMTIVLSILLPILKLNTLTLG